MKRYDGGEGRGLTDVQHGGRDDEVAHGGVGFGGELVELFLGVRGRGDCFFFFFLLTVGLDLLYIC